MSNTSARLLKGEAEARLRLRRRAVAAEFAAYGRAVAAERPRDLRFSKALPSEWGEHIPLFGGELAVCHDVRPLLGG